MDKIELSVQDIEALLEWRDLHRSEVRNHPAPLKAIEIVMPHNGYSIKGIRDGQRLRLHLSQWNKQMGNCEFIRRPDGLWEATKNRMQVDRDGLQSILTVYCSLMAIMAYGRSAAADGELAPDAEAPKRKGKSASTKAKKKRTTYILKAHNGELMAFPRGSHASPRGVFIVRGHFRHYKNGKVIWVSEYKKGTGKQSRKTYKLGSIDDIEGRGK